MNDYKDIIRQAKPGQIVPIVKRIDMQDPVDFFARISDYGRARNCCLLESREYLADSGALSFGTSRPALYLTGRGNEFTIKALSKTGVAMLEYLSKHRTERFAFCQTVNYSAQAITGTIKPPERSMDEEARLKSTNQMDVIRAVAFAL